MKDVNEVGTPSIETERERPTHIAPSTFFEGTLHAAGDVEIHGDFSGELVSDGMVVIRSMVKSSITAKRVVVYDGELNGDLVVSGDVAVDEKSTVIGNVRAANLLCAGKIKGNLNIQNRIDLKSTSAVEGDVRTALLSTENGAKLCGRMDMDSLQ